MYFISFLPEVCTLALGIVIGWNLKKWKDRWSSK